MLFELPCNSEHVAHAWKKKQILLEYKFRSPTAVELNNSYKQRKLPIWLYTSAPIYELPSNVGTIIQSYFVQNQRDYIYRVNKNTRDKRHFGRFRIFFYIIKNLTIFGFLHFSSASKKSFFPRFFRGRESFCKQKRCQFWIYGQISILIDTFLKNDKILESFLAVFL